MAVRTVSFKYGRKINLGDYNSADLECGVWLELEEGQTPEDGIAECLRLAREAVKEAARPITQKQAAQVREVFAGLPVELQESLLAQLGRKDTQDAH